MVTYQDKNPDSNWLPFKVAVIEALCSTHYNSRPVKHMCKLRLFKDWKECLWMQHIQIKENIIQNLTSKFKYE